MPFRVFGNKPITEVDMNRDGSVSIVEAILSQQKRFHKIDKNADNQLVMEEVKYFLSSSGSEKTFDEYRTSFNKMDTFINGALTELEFLEALEHRFSKRDANHDNILTANELKN